MPACTPETLAALATIGLEAAHGLTRQTIRDSINQSFVMRTGGAFCSSEVYCSADPAFMEAFPRGLTIMEALGFSVVLDWADQPTKLLLGDIVVRTSGKQALDPGDTWMVMLPAANTPTREMPSPEALALASALLHIRRIVWPSIPWRPRDPVAEHLERHVRLIEASMRPPQRPEVITPYCAQSDVGRDWSR